MEAAAVTAEPVRDETPRRPWWTETDDAELAALTWELVDGIFEHREHCSSCARSHETGLPCPHIAKAIQLVVEWVRGRDLCSYARWVRLQRDLLELRQDGIVHRLRGRR